MTDTGAPDFPEGFDVTELDDYIRTMRQMFSTSLGDEPGPGHGT